MLEENREEKVNINPDAIEMSQGAEELMAEEEVSEIIASLRIMLGDDKKREESEAQVVSEKEVEDPIPDGAEEIPVEELSEARPKPEPLDVKLLFEGADLPTTVGLMAMVGFRAIWILLSTIAIDVFNLLKHFALWIALGIKGTVHGWIEDVSSDWKFFRKEFREADNRENRQEVADNYIHMFQKISNVLLPTLGLVVLLITITRWTGTTYALEVSSGDKSLGYIENEAVYTSAESMVRESISADITGDDSIVEINPLYKVVTVKSSQLLDADTISDSIVENAKEDARYACGIYVDGKFLCALSSELDARQVFNNILDKYPKEKETDIVGFVEEVQFVQGLYDDNEDTVWDSEELSQKLSKDKVVSVKVVKTVTVKESTAFKTIKSESSKLYKGTQRIKRKGVKGTDNVTYLVTYIDGKKKSSKEIDRVTVTKPVDQLVEVGTKKTSGGASTYKKNGAKLIWPVPGVYSISSPYGRRWGRLHGGIDITNGHCNGKTVVAAASGTVVQAGYDSSYGYHVVIKHSSSMSTCYAHMQKGSLKVKTGQYVTGGQPIGRVGSTGHSTGPHCHFEVRINGNRVNPRNYVG